MRIEKSKKKAMIGIQFTAIKNFDRDPWILQTTIDKLRSG